MAQAVGVVVAVAVGWLEEEEAHRGQGQGVWNEMMGVVGALERRAASQDEGRCLYVQTVRNGFRGAGGVRFLIVGWTNKKMH